MSQGWSHSSYTEIKHPFDQHVVNCLFMLLLEMLYWYRDMPSSKRGEVQKISAQGSQFFGFRS